MRSLIGLVKDIYYNIKIHSFNRRVNRQFIKYRNMLNNIQISYKADKMINFGYDMEKKLLYPELKILFYNYDEDKLLEDINLANIELINKFGRFYTMVLDPDIISKYIILKFKNVYRIYDYTVKNGHEDNIKGDNIDLLYYTMI